MWGRRQAASPTRFRDRQDAGRKLAATLDRRNYPQPIVLALPRGGVPVAAEVAARLHAPLDVVIVRKLGCPWRPELGIGAIAESGVLLRNEHLITRLGITPGEFDAVVAAERAEVMRRARRYRGDRPPVAVRDRTVVVVDDGLATGFTARAAIEILRRRGAQQVILAAPVGPSDTVEELQAVADEVVCLRTPVFITGIGQWYGDFAQVRDEEVADLLARHDAPSGSGESAPDPLVRDVRVPAGAVWLPGTLTTPRAPIGAVIFAHGSGSSRLSPRNTAVARALNGHGMATLLFDLLSTAEAADRSMVFDVDLLAERLDHATRWLEGQPDIQDLGIGYFGASTGAAAALVAAAGRRHQIRAVVSRGGRPDLAAGHLQAVAAPTLLIVGEHDPTVIACNEQAQRRLGGPSRIAIVPGATHLFSEPGTLERVTELAQDWFATHLPGSGAGRQGGTEPVVQRRPDHRQ